MESSDPQTFKIRDASSYDAVTGQFDYFTERLARPFAARLVALAEIAPTENVLDIGTGTGVVALEAAKIFDDSEGMVYAIDLSEKMLSKAKEKAGRLGLEKKATFSRMDAERLAFADKKFDLVVSLFALLHFPDPLAALKEIYRVTHPAGRLVLAVGSGAPVFSLSGWLHLFKKIPDFLQDLRGRRLAAPHFLDSLVEQYVPKGDAPEESHLAHHTRHHRTQAVASLVKKAGFDILKTGWHGRQELIDTPEEFWEIQRTFSSIARKRMSAAEAADIDALYKIFIEKCREVQARGGRLVYPFGAFYVIARRPVSKFHAI